MTMARIIDLTKIKECISWGHQGENGATILMVDIGDFISQYPEGQPVVIFQRQDGHPYIHNFSTAEENLSIELNSTDTQQQGKCEVQISWVSNGNRILKKKTYQSFILPPSLEGELPLTKESIIALDNLEEYVESARKLLEEAEDYAAELNFVDSLPLAGENARLYIEKDTNALYYWDEEKFVQLSSSNISTPQVIFGGDAFTPN